MYISVLVIVKNLVKEHTHFLDKLDYHRFVIRFLLTCIFPRCFIFKAIYFGQFNRTNHIVKSLRLAKCNYIMHALLFISFLIDEKTKMSFATSGDARVQLGNVRIKPP